MLAAQKRSTVRAFLVAIMWGGAQTPILANPVPVDTTWDWAGHMRTLNIDFHQDVDDFLVGGIPMGDLVRLTTDAFTNANLGWNFTEDPNEPAKLWVRMGQHPGDFQQAVGDGSASEIDDLLAIFRRPEGAVNEMGETTIGEILFNPWVPWGLTGAQTFDPIIIAMHELGHAMRLDHDDGVMNGDTMGVTGSVMRPKLMKGVHRLNSNNPNVYGLSAEDVTAITDSAQMTAWIPEPTMFPLVALGGLMLARRRQR